jgi:branched-chain amino acid aminotransferase
MADRFAYMNGEFIPEAQARIDPMDRGFYVGDAVFDIARTYDGRPFKLREHTERLYRSLKYVRIDPGIDLEEMIAVSEELVRRNEGALADAGDWYVWQTVTRGVAATRAIAAAPTVLVMTKPVPWNPWGTFYKDGAHAAITRTRAYSGQSLEPKIKHYSRMNFNLAELEARDVDPAALPILLDMDGNVAEGTGYNVAIVTDGVIKTPGDRSILRGISRDTMFELAAQKGIPTSEEALQPYDVYNADEVFFVTSPTFVTPVTVVDRRTVGDGRPGPVVGKLLAAFSELVGVDVVGQAEQQAKRA